MSLFDSLNQLSSGEIDKLHQGTLSILEDVGVKIKQKTARDMLDERGAAVKGEIVKIPSELVERAIDNSPSSVNLRARNKKYNLPLNCKRPLFTNGYGATEVVEGQFRKEFRKATLKDLRNFTILADSLDNVDYCLPQVIPQDVPSTEMDLVIAYTLLTNTSKNVHLSMMGSDLIDEVIEIGEIVSDRNGRTESPVFSLGCCPNSPLVYPHDSTERLIKAAKKGIPFLVVSGAASGATAPVTLAGTLVLQNAEILAGITLAQIVNEGTPVIYGTFASPIDMARGKQALGVPEISILNVASSDLCRRYKIPLGYGTGGVSDSYYPDVQAGIEKATTALFAVLGGVEVVHHGASGILGAGRAASYEQMFLDNELCSMIKRYLGEVKVNTETMALDQIREAGPGGNFLKMSHTVRNTRSELYLTNLWAKEKDESALDFAEGEVKHLLENHNPEPVDTDKITEMQKVLTASGIDWRGFGE